MDRFIRWTGALGVLVLAPLSVAGQGGLTEAEALRELERLRTEAEPLWQAGDPAGAVLLERAWRHVEGEEFATLLRGSLTLQTRIPNLARETACAYAILGDTARALDGFRRIGASGGRYDLFLAALERECGEAFTPLRTLPPYERLEEIWRADHVRWTSPSLRTEYRERLPVAERVAGLSLLWYRVKEYFPSFEVNPGLDWDSVYLATIPRVLAAEDTWAYYRELERFLAALGDAHTDVFFPEPLRARRYSRPPMLTLPVEGRPVVVRVSSPTLERIGVRVGQEVLEVDGVPVDAYVAERVAPYVSSSTPQDLGVRALGYQLLAGDRDTPVRLTVRDPARGRLELVVPRTGYDDVVPGAVTMDTVLAGNIGYLRVDGFNADSLRAYIPAALERLAGTDGLIVDVRRNGGGSTTYGYAILSALVEEPVIGARSRSLSIVPTWRGWGHRPMPVPLSVSMIQPSQRVRYRNPVIVLTGPMTFSAAEDFVLAFDALALGTIMGEATGGNSGQPFRFELPGGGIARVRTKHDGYPDGRDFIGTGIQPHVVVRPTIAGIGAGRDEVLEAALARLRGRRR